MAANGGASCQVAAGVPPYEALAAVLEPDRQPAWLCDSVLVQQLQFLFNTLAPCTARLPEVQSLPCALLTELGSFIDTPDTGRRFRAQA